MPSDQLKTIEEEWNIYYDMIYKGVNPSAVQRRELRLAFFAGATVIVNSVVIISSEAVTEEEGIKYIEARYREVMDFGTKTVLEALLSQDESRPPKDRDG
jgi:hypothetical protein